MQTSLRGWVIASLLLALVPSSLCRGEDTTGNPAAAHAEYLQSLESIEYAASVTWTVGDDDPVTTRVLVTASGGQIANDPFEMFLADPLRYAFRRYQIPQSAHPASVTVNGSEYLQLRTVAEGTVVEVFLATEPPHLPMIARRFGRGAKPPGVVERFEVKDTRRVGDLVIPTTVSIELQLERPIAAVATVELPGDTSVTTAEAPGPEELKFPLDGPFPVRLETVYPDAYLQSEQYAQLFSRAPAEAILQQLETPEGAVFVMFYGFGNSDTAAAAHLRATTVQPAAQWELHGRTVINWRGKKGAVATARANFQRQRSQE